MDFKLVVQNCLSSNSSNNKYASFSKAFVSYSDLKNLKIKAGNVIQLTISNKLSSEFVSLYLKIWPSNNIIKGNVILNSFWKPQFESYQPLNNVTISIFDRTKEVIDADKIILTNFDDTEKLHDNFDFKCFIAHSLQDLIIQGPVLFSLPWISQKITIKVLDISSSIKNIDNSNFLFRICSQTKIIISDNSSQHRVCQLTPTTCESQNINFGGYKDLIQSLYQTVAVSLGVNSSNSNQSFSNLATKGVLITGPHGIGKTRLMNEIANQFDFHKEVIDLDKLLSNYLGDAEMAIRKVFINASLNSPSIILFDDVDHVLKKRSAESSDFQKRLVSCILSLIDGVEEIMHHVIVIATSSRPDHLDPALLRAGRIDKEFELTAPTSSDRLEIMKYILKDLKIKILDDDDGIQLRDLIFSGSHGMISSDLIKVCKEAIMISICCKSSSPNIQINDSDSLESNFRKLDITTSSPNNSYCKISNRCTDSATLEATSNIIDSDHIGVSIANISEALSKIKPSSIRDIALEIPNIFWSDIGGMDELKESLKQVVEWPLKYPEVFEKLNISPPKGVLLYGPPGCSKTLMAKALATESKMNFLAVRGPELLSKWLGESEKAVQALFKRAKSSAPCIIFFDEIDALAIKRGETSAGVNDRVLSQLLTEIDSIQFQQISSSVVIIAATNRPDMLDAALLRPGRFDRKIYVPPPDNKAREQILSMKLSKIPTSDDVDIQPLVDKTLGFSGAEVVAAVSESAFLAMEDNLDMIYQIHLLESIASIKPQINQEMLDFYDNIYF